MNRPPGFHELPPFWIRAGSWFFVFFLASPLVAIPYTAGDGTVAMLGMQFDWGAGAPLPWAVILEGLLFAGGLTGLAILMCWRWAYNFGMVYASVSIAVGVLGLLAGAGGVRGHFLSAAIQQVALALFLVHLVRHRRQWSDSAARRQPGFFMTRRLLKGP